MKHDIRARARQRFDDRLAAFRPADRLAVPPKGWVRAIRDALGMSGAQLARRLGISPQSVDALERSEANGTIKLETLRRAAEALDCTLVYALVPNTPLETRVQARARAIAIHDLSRVAHTMRLEAQETGNADLEARIDAYVRDRIRLRDLWEQR